MGDDTTMLEVAAMRGWERGGDEGETWAGGDDCVGDGEGFGEDGGEE